MTPAQHYAEAERHLDYAMQSTKNDPMTGINFQAAQVHATLAMVPEGRAVLAAADEPESGLVLAAALRELRSVLEEFHGVSHMKAMQAQMPTAALTERINRLAALERGDLVAYQAARR